MNCFHFLHRNPINAGLVSNLKDWAYSSYLDYAGLRNGTLCDKEIFISLTGLTQDDIIKGADTEFEDDFIKKFY